MMRQFCCTAALMCVSAAVAPAQTIAANIEFYGDVGFLGGVVPIKTPTSTRTLLVGGGQGEFGLQGEKVGGALGLRFSQCRPSGDLGCEAVDLFGTMEFRANRGSLTTWRLGYAIGDESFDDGLAGGSELARGQVNTVSVGVGREFFVPSTARILIALDVLFPSASSSVHRAAPALQLQVAYRGRWLKSVRTLPGGQR